jgi:hypothetical protein
VFRWMLLIMRSWILIGSRIRTRYVSSGLACGNRILFPLTPNDDRYLVLLAEVSGEINPERRNRSYPRVVKRKMSNFPVKRAASTTTSGQQAAALGGGHHRPQQDRAPTPNSQDHLNDWHCG